MRKQTGGGKLEIKQYSGEVGQENEGRIGEQGSTKRKYE